MRTDADFLQELELLETFQLLGRSTPVAPAEVEKPAAKIAPDIELTSSPRVPVQAAKMATVPVTVDPARVARIATLGWAALQQESATCNACGLCKQRKQAVFGVGAADAPWLFVGEGPGAEEDEQGEPFVGQAGKLLDAMLTAAGLLRGREVYIANVVKCRPPGNRTPTLDEAAACAPLLDRQIDLIQPKLIVALGKTAVIRLTGSDASMASMRGSVYNYRGIAVVATYHPAYLLRSLTEKLKAWEDMLFARAEMGKQESTKV
jgi:uracil-DNA glycosylase